MPSLGDVVAKLREEAGLTRLALAKAAKVDPSILARLEYGERDEVRLETFCRLAEVFGLSLDELAAAAGLLSKKRSVSLTSAAEVARLRATLEKVGRLTADAIGDGSTGAKPKSKRT
jgi:transcriptional regulator with XRE-family HTH domain